MFALEMSSLFQITFDSVGGLSKHIRSLKEMIVFPLLYPEVFDRFKIQPPRGVLFYGPPGMCLKFDADVGVFIALYLCDACPLDTCTQIFLKHFEEILHQFISRYW